MAPATVEQFLHQLNEAWLTQDYEALNVKYDPDVVLLPPDAGEPIEGREAVCSAYEDFHSACIVDRFEATRISSWSFTSGQTQKKEDGLVTKAHMRFEIDYQLRSNSQTFCEQGLEVYTLVICFNIHRSTGRVFRYDGLLSAKVTAR